MGAPARRWTHHAPRRGCLGHGHERFAPRGQNPSLSEGSGSISPSPQGLDPFLEEPYLRPIALRPQRPAPMRSAVSPPHILASGSESPSSPLTVPSTAYGPVTLDDMAFDCFTHSNVVPTVIHQHSILYQLSNLRRTTFSMRWPFRVATWTLRPLQTH